MIARLFPETDGVELRGRLYSSGLKTDAAYHSSGNNRLTPFWVHLVNRTDWLMSEDSDSAGHIHYTYGIDIYLEWVGDPTAAIMKRFKCHTMWRNNTDDSFDRFDGWQAYEGTGTMGGLQFYFDSGDVASGFARIEGRTV